MLLPFSLMLTQNYNDFMKRQNFFSLFFYFLLLLFARFCLYIIIIGMFSTAFGRFFALF